jgi:hypothetical protein
MLIDFLLGRIAGGVGWDLLDCHLLRGAEAPRDSPTIYSRASHHYWLCITGKPET